MEKSQKMRRGDFAYDGKRRWSAIDTVIVLLVFVAVVGLVLRVVFSYRDAQKEANTATVFYDVHFEIDEMYEASLDNISGADKVYLCETGELLGYVGVDNSENETESESTDALAAAPADKEGKLAKKLYPRPRVEGTDPDMVSAEGVICTEGEMVDGSLLAGKSGIYLAKGTEITVCTERVVLHIRVIDIVTRQGEN